MQFKAKYLLVLIPLIFVGLIIYLFSDIVAYIVIAWVVSMIGAPLMSFFKRFLGKNMAAGITLLIFVLIFLSLMWMFIPPLIQQTQNLANVDYESVLQNLEEPIKSIEDKFSIQLNHRDDHVHVDVNVHDQKPISTEIIYLDSILKSNNLLPLDSTSNRDNIALIINLPEHLHEEQVKSDSTNETLLESTRKKIYSLFDLTKIQNVLKSIVGFLGNIFITLMSVLFISFFFLREQGLVEKFLSSIVPDKYENQAVDALKQSSSLLVRYFLGVTLQVTLITIFMSIVLSVLGIKNALLIAFFAALVNVIPYLGPFLGAGFAVIITLSSNIDLAFYDELLPMLLKIIISFGAMQLLDNFVFQPNIFSRSVKAHPLEIFIVILMGAKLGGILGMVLAIPAYTVLRVVAKEFLSNFKIIQSLTRGI